MVVPMGHTDCSPENHPCILTDLPNGAYSLEAELRYALYHTLHPFRMSMMIQTFFHQVSAVMIIAITVISPARKSARLVINQIDDIA